ncbi:hypothetical protein B0H19DRAFT_1190316 [Mycena capillaripes]|nr:hypothetical protein B0H19DRAFT_1190316 [Mycena capillaripes]
MPERTLGGWLVGQLLLEHLICSPNIFTTISLYFHIQSMPRPMKRRYFENHAPISRYILTQSSLRNQGIKI